MDVFPQISDVNSDYYKYTLKAAEVLNSDYIYSEAYIPNLDTLASTDTERVLDSSVDIIKANLAPLINQGSSVTQSNTMSEIQYLGKLLDLKTLTIESSDSLGLADYGQSLNSFIQLSETLFNSYLNSYINPSETNFNLTNGNKNFEEVNKNLKEFLRKTEIVMAELDKLRDAKWKEYNQKRVKNYIDDFKFMMKMFSPESTMRQSTEALIGSYERILSAME